MTAFETIFGEDRIRTAILGHLPAHRTTNQTIRFNCPMCVLYGETADRRQRGGMALDRVAISCFNCRFKTRFEPGQPLSAPLKAFLAAIGIGHTQISRLNHWATMLHGVAAEQPAILQQMTTQPGFPARTLPDQAQTLQAWSAAGCTDADYLAACAYLRQRGDTIAAATAYYWTPERRFDLHRRVIIPCWDHGVLVGWTARSVDPAITPKYHKATPPNLLFNSAALSHPRRHIAILQEGVFDALAIDAVGLLGNALNEQQARWINASGKQIIVVPDRDKAGGRLIDAALQYHWSVAFPRMLSVGQARWWGPAIKDTADAVRAYGTLYTLRSILDTTTDNRMNITLRRQDFS